MKLSLSESRMTALLTNSIVLLSLCLTLTLPRAVHADNFDTRISQDHNHPAIGAQYLGTIDEVVNQNSFEEALPARAQSLRNRDVSGVLYLQNNSPANKEIEIGATQNWAVSKSVIEGSGGESGSGLPGQREEDVEHENTKYELRKRQSQTSVYITINTCLQPKANGTTQNSTVPPQLQMFLSTSSDDQTPGPSSSGDVTQMDLIGGYGLFNITADSDVYIGVTAPNTTDFEGSWTYEIAASIDAPYHQVETSVPFLHFVDSDFHAALLATDDLTTQLPNSSVYQEWMGLKPPYGMFAQNQADQAILGVSNSYCGLRSNALITANLENIVNQNVVGMTNRGLGGHPKEQFYITDLDSSSTYWGFLAMQGNSTMSGQNVVGGGGKVWAAMTFSTKAEENCALMYNLTFCSEVAYAVPTNPNLFSPRTGLPALAAIYDSYAASMYNYFNYSLQQIPCNTTASAQYSLARNCDDCAEQYKRWLCTVTIPRCEDYSNPASWLQPRNVAQPFPNGTTILPNSFNNTQLLNAVASNQSRNAIIDAQIQPGPYKEVLPCYDVCYNLVQSCPAALGFGCPLAGAGMENSYGQRSTNSSLITCSWLGAAYDLSAANAFASVPRLNVVVGLVVALVLLMSV